MQADNNKQVINWYKILNKEKDFKVDKENNIAKSLITCQTLCKAHMQGSTTMLKKIA